jgi:hypothetical protein
MQGTTTPHRALLEKLVTNNPPPLLPLGVLFSIVYTAASMEYPRSILRNADEYLISSTFAITSHNFRFVTFLQFYINLWLLYIRWCKQLLTYIFAFNSTWRFEQSMIVMKLLMWKSLNTWFWVECNVIEHAFLLLQEDNTAWLTI